MLYTATVENASELATRWVNVRAAVRGGMRRGVSLGVKEGADEAKAFHRFKNRTGYLERSIRGYVTGSRSGANTRRGNIGATFGPLRGTDLSGAAEAHWGVIEATADYASHVEEGTRPHIIEARNARLLRWVSQGGQVRFAKRVKHPGGRPYTFMSFAYFKCERVMLREIERGVAFAQTILDR